MARYNARLLNLLVRVRKRTEEVHALALAGTQRDIAQCRSYRDALLAQQRAQLMTAEARTHTDFDASDVRRFYQHERHLASLSDAKDAELQQLGTVEHEQRGALEDALKARKVVEQLKDRRQLHHLKEIDKQEVQQLDEAVLMHRTNRKAEGKAGHSGLLDEASQ